MNRSLHKSPLVSVLESKQPSRQPLAEYKDFVREHYDGPAGAMTAVTGILQPGGKLLLMCTEDTFLGAWCSRLWHCRTYNRRELRRTCAECGLVWERELWFSPVHRRLRLGGIISELIRV